MLIVGMSGVKLGERLAQIGCAHGGRLAAVARKVGLSGRAVAIVPDEVSARRAQKGAADAGVLVEIVTSQPTRAPIEDAAFDVVVIDDTARFLREMELTDRAATIHEAHRLLRPGGRVMVIGRTPRQGLRALLIPGPDGPPLDAEPLLKAEGFRSVRTLAEREGFVFVEGVKPRQPE
jgi:ubiquinone/menaquinone biosynthesis C-methylase UbiE